MKRMILLGSLLLLLAMHTNAQSSPVFSDQGIAIHGYDAVAFFQQSKPVKGNMQFSYRWQEATWLFETQATLDSFQRSPESYAPQYGGYCAFGTSRGYKAPTAIDTWTIVNGKLYFNYNQDVKSTWTKQRDKYIAAADANWPGIALSK